MSQAFLGYPYTTFSSGDAYYGGNVLFATPKFLSLPPAKCTVCGAEMVSFDSDGDPIMPCPHPGVEGEQVLSRYLVFMDYAKK